MEQILKPLHLACVNDDMRPNLALIQIKNGIAQATNGSIIVRLNLLECGYFSKEILSILEGKYIHMEAWKEAHKCDDLQVDEFGLHITKKGICKNIEFSTAIGEFFNIQSVIDNLKGKEKITKSVKKIKDKKGR